MLDMAAVHVQCWVGSNYQRKLHGNEMQMLVAESPVNTTIRQLQLQWGNMDPAPTASAADS